MPWAKEWESIGEEIELAWKELVLPIMKVNANATISRTTCPLAHSPTDQLAFFYCELLFVCLFLI